MFERMNNEITVFFVIDFYYSNSFLLVNLLESIVLNEKLYFIRKFTIRPSQSNGTPTKTESRKTFR